MLCIFNYLKCRKHLLDIVRIKIPIIYLPTMKSQSYRPAITICFLQRYITFLFECLQCSLKSFSNYGYSVATFVPIGIIPSRAVVHCNHHFDTKKRLHPLLHPLNTGDASPSIRALDQATLHFMDNCRVVFSFTKKEISTHQGQYLFLFL